MKPLADSTSIDRAETVKYIDDLEMNTQFDVLGDTYFEQLRAVLNYGLTYKPPAKYTPLKQEKIITTTPDEINISPNLFMLIEVSTDVKTDIDIWGRLEFPKVDKNSVGFLVNKDTKYLVWGGDDRDSGKEQLLVKVSEIYKDFPDNKTIIISVLTEILKNKYIYRQVYPHTIERPHFFKVSLYSAFGYISVDKRFIFTDATLITEESGTNVAIVYLTKSTTEEYSILLSSDEHSAHLADYDVKKLTAKELIPQHQYEDLPCDYILVTVPNGKRKHKELSLVTPYNGYDEGYYGHVHHTPNVLPDTTDLVKSFYNDGVDVKGFINLKAFQEFQPKLSNLKFSLSGYWWRYEDAPTGDTDEFTIEIAVYKGGVLELEDGTPVVKKGNKIIQKTFQHSSTHTPEHIHPELDEGDWFIDFDILVGTTDPIHIKIIKNLEHTNA